MCGSRESFFGSSLEILWNSRLKPLVKLLGLNTADEHKTRLIAQLCGADAVLGKCVPEGDISGAEWRKCSQSADKGNDTMRYSEVQRNNQI